MDEGRFTETCASRFWRVLMGIILEELLASYTDVKKCSQEGREQMSIDTNNIYNTATGICDIQPADDAKDLKYVLDYITCCKLDEPSDVVAWVEKHQKDYTYEVVESILNYAMAKKLNKQKFKELKESIQQLYVEEEVVEELCVCLQSFTVVYNSLQTSNKTVTYSNSSFLEVYLEDLQWESKPSDSQEHGFWVNDEQWFQK